MENSKEITNFLIEKVGMKKIFIYQIELERLGYQDNKFSCFMRIHEIHYLYWSEDLKHFSLGVFNEKPKGKAGGGSQRLTCIMIPKTINSIEDAIKLLEGVIDIDYLKVLS